MKSREGKAAAQAESDDPSAVGLVFSSDADPGISRVRAGTGFWYRDADGDRVSDQPTLDRIRALVIPPAWIDVWICASPRGHLQATGRDQRGRKQYRYHTKWRDHRDGDKFGRLANFGATLPCIRSQLESDLRRHGLPREKVVAVIIALLDQTAVRVGNDEYARTNRSYGLTTLLDRHVATNSTSLQIRFPGKSGKRQSVTVHDRRLARAVKRCQDLPGQRLFVYESENGQPVSISSSDVNEYLRDLTGQDFTAKTFRTWAGTTTAVAILRHVAVPASEPEATHEIVQAVDAVAERLGNTRTVARQSYIHPSVIQSWQDGILQKIKPLRVARGGSGGLTVDERVTLALLSDTLTGRPERN